MNVYPEQRPYPTDEPAAPAAAAPQPVPPAYQAPPGGTPYGPPPPPPWPGGWQGAGPAAPEPHRPPQAWRGRLVAGGVLVALCFGAGAGGAALVASRDSEASLASTVVAAPVSGSNAPTEQLAKVAAAVSPSVVSIAVSGQQGSSEGSGIVLRSNGTILTNNHVVADAASGGSIRVKFSDGKTVPATLIGRDPSSDLAVIRAQGVSGLTPATLAASDSIHVGDTVLAIGSPLGLDGSVSAGIVSALHRPVALGGSQQRNPFGGGQSTPSNTLPDAIQTDAPINPGNSGGALVDTQGRVVGINTAIATLGAGAGGESGNIGVGFAIPIDQAADVADTLLKGETPAHALLGVQSGDATTGDGAVIGTVTAGSAAEKAGIKEGDVITALGGRTVSDATDLGAAVRSHKPGDKVEITYRRNGTTGTATATLGSATS